MTDSQQPQKKSIFIKIRPVALVLFLLGAVIFGVTALVFFQEGDGESAFVFLVYSVWFFMAFVSTILTTKEVVEYIARYWQPAVRGIVLTLLLATLFFFGFKPTEYTDDEKARKSYAKCLAFYDKSLRGFEYAKHNVTKAIENRSMNQTEFEEYLALRYSKLDSATEDLKTKEAEKEVAKKKYQMLVYLSVLIRAICLGALGAIASMLARQVIEQNESSFFGKPKFWDTLITNSLLGAIVSVVVICLFFTKQLTIFKPDISRIEPDYWRITLVCIIAGAFSKRIYSYVESGVNRFGPAGNQP